MDDSHDLVVRTIREHAGALLRTARRHSLCADDAHDAYQRALEIFLRRASSLEPDTVDRWLHVVVKHEAQAVRRTRQQLVASDEVDLDGRPCDAAPDADERLMRFDRLSRSAEALQRLKPQEVTALWLKAQGLSYTEIAERQSWTYTKVNRCITEGRRAFLERYAGIETGEECRRWSPVLSALVDGEATAEQLAAARPHLRRCSACKATLRELHAAGPRMAGVLPAPGPGLGLGLAGAGASGAGVVGMAGVAAGGAGGGRLETLVRGVESAATGLQERMAGWAVKVQMAGDVAAGGKVAAVA
ncbi:MAG TPA: sigma-70 family RNA polymerase sigma factor, partial [Miltoncostaeaceae bacterium]|nr:sigma-70 family RNA polymerase sigma factor [Miltoncostaeaceae bacterium]